MRLTEKSIQSLKTEYSSNRRDIRWDDELPGFGVRIYPSGRKSFVLSYRIANRKRLMTLGSTSQLSVVLARKKAKRLMGRILEGTDPIEEKKRGQKKQLLFRELCEVYIENYAKSHKRSWKEDARRIQQHLVPAWNSRYCTSITKKETLDIHLTIGKTAPYEANRTLALVSRMFSLAHTWDLLPEHTNPTKGIKKFKETKRSRWLKADEIERLASAIFPESNPYIKGAIWMMLFTGLRKNEILTAKWSQVSFKEKTITIPTTKSGNSHVLALPSPAIAILKSLPRELSNPHIFPGRKDGGHLVSISKAWQRIRASADLNDVRLHDLRRTVGSWLAQSGNTLQVIGNILNHSNLSTTGDVYAVLSQAQPRAALEDYATKISGYAKEAEMN